MNDYATLRGLAVGDALGARFERIDGTRSLELAEWRASSLGWKKDPPGEALAAETQWTWGSASPASP